MAEGGPFNYPYVYCPHGKVREMFADYGTCALVNTLNGTNLMKQKDSGSNCVRYASSQPVLPLNSQCCKVLFPSKDVVMGNIIDNNRKMKQFHTRVKRFYSEKLVKAYKLGEMGHIKSAIEEMKEDKRFIYPVIQNKMTPWFQDMLKAYNDLADCVSIQWNNYKYAGGCISVTNGRSGDYNLITASGIGFQTISLSTVHEQHKGIMHAIPQCKVDLDDTIYGITSDTVQGKAFVAVKTDSKCMLYKIDKHKGSIDKHTGSKLRLMNSTVIPENNEAQFQSISISPYIPGECVISLTDGSCYLWHDETLDKVASPTLPRFFVNDGWNHVQYGSHPRQILYCDQTVLQIMDLRVPNGDGIDLFCLPDKSLHNRERLRACARHPASNFYHVVATDYSLLLTDERFTKYPVLKWDHLLCARPQYISGVKSADHSTIASSGEKEGNFIYVGSQYPAEVHGFRFAEISTGTPVSIAKPHRAAKLVDISKWASFTENCCNPKLLDKRLNTSLAGVAVLPVPNGHTVFQMDCYGEVFHQTFFKTASANQDVTFSAGLGSHDLKPGPVAVQRARQWAESWEKMTKQDLHKHTMKADVRPNQYGLLYHRDPNSNCCLCKPALTHVPGFREDTSNTDFCVTCMTSTRDAYDLTNSNLDTITPSDSLAEPANLYEVDNLSHKSALSRLLLKHWQKDGDIDHILLDWDKEVIEKRKMAKMKKSAGGNDASQDLSLVTQLLGLNRHSQAQNSENDSIQEDLLLDVSVQSPHGSQSYNGDHNFKIPKQEPVHINSPRSSLAGSTSSKSDRRTGKSPRQSKSREKLPFSGSQQVHTKDITEQSSLSSQGPYIATRLDNENQGQGASNINIRKKSSEKDGETLSIVSGTTVDDTEHDLNLSLSRGIEGLLEEDDAMSEIISPTFSEKSGRKTSYNSDMSQSLFSSPTSFTSIRKKKKKNHEKKADTSVDESPNNKQTSPAGDVSDSPSKYSIQSKLSVFDFPGMFSSQGSFLFSGKPLSQSQSFASPKKNTKKDVSLKKLLPRTLNDIF